jgi:hypothetical protein
MMVQSRFKKDIQLRKPYSYGSYNKVRGDKQAIRITEGCVWNCPWCYEPTEIKIFGVPEIVRNHVLIYDMNLLCKSDALRIIEDLGKIRVDDKVVKYELVCGIYFRFLTQEIANALYANRFKRIRLAWDGSYKDQMQIKYAIDLLLKAGYKRKDIMVFFICNHQSISMAECSLKLDLCKVWNVKVCDCYFDGQVMPHVSAYYWTEQEIKSFRHKVRKHNQLVNFGIDPEINSVTVK